MRFDSSHVEYNAESSRFSWLDYFRRIRLADLKSKKFLLSSITTLFTITGLVLLIVGSVVLAECNKYNNFVGYSFLVLPRFVITTAVFIFIIAALGFYGAISEKNKIVTAYIILLVPILVFEIAITVLAFDLQYNSYYDINNNMYINNPSISYVKANWDDMQRELLCCGFYGQYFMVLENLPISCCSIPVGARSPFECTTRNSYYERCDEKLSWMMDDNAYNIGVTGAVLTCVQGIIIGVAAWISYKLKYKKEIPFDEFGNVIRDSRKIAPPSPVVVDYSKY